MTKCLKAILMSKISKIKIQQKGKKCTYDIEEKKFFP